MGRRKLTGEEIRARDAARKARGPNADIGTRKHHCGAVGHIRRNVKGKLYMLCENCGMLHYNAPGGQAYLAEFIDEQEQDSTTPKRQPAEVTKEAEPRVDRKPEVATKPKPEPQPKPRGGFTLLDCI